MTDTLSYFLNYFGISDLANLEETVTAGQFLGMAIVGFIAVIITAIGVRSIMEFIKILTNYKNFM